MVDTSSNKPPLISIVTCTKNQAKYIQELLDSVTSQTVRNFEHIIIDGGSTDGTREKLAEYQKNFGQEFPIKIFEYPPKGISDAMNKGIQHATGAWLIFVQGDDYLIDKNAMRRMQQEIEKAGTYSWLVGNTTYKMLGLTITTNGYILKRLRFQLLKYLNTLNHQNVLMRRELFQKFGDFRLDYRMTMDYEYYLRLLSHGIHPKAIPTEFAVFRKHKEGFSANPKYLPLHMQEDDKVRQEYREKISWEGLR